MRRIDVARKVLVGGLATSRTGDGKTTLIGDDHNLQSSRYWKRWFDSSQSGVSVTPYNGNYCYRIEGGYIYVDEDSDISNGYLARYNIKIKKSKGDEPTDFKDGNISGVLQRMGNKARFGLEFFNTSEGGKVHVSVKSGNIKNIITSIENKKADTWTPLAEAFYEGVRYFQQISPYYYSGDYTTNNQNDPYYWEEIQDFVPCGRSFVLLITDGESTQDRNIPSTLQDYDGDGNDPGTYDSDGSDYLDDVAFWAHTSDLRPDLDGAQNITLYAVLAFGGGSQLLKDAAKNGGFIDKNGDNSPDQDSEWDADGNGVPDTYYEAPGGYELEKELLQALTAILKRSASGTAVSVLATSGEGDGNLVQAYFRPTVSSGITEVRWVGYLQSLWVDTYGNLREDSDGDLSLDVEKDKVIEYFFDPDTGDTKIKRFSVSSTNPYPASSDPYEEVELDDIKPLWEAGDLLAQRDPDERKIFTYIDKDKDGVVDEPTGANDPFDDNGEVIRFHTSGATNIMPYLGVKDHSRWKYLGATHLDRANNLIQYIQGKESGFSGTTTMNIRSRVIDGNVWKLGDIVHSTPIPISKPTDNYHIQYSDESYQDYYNAFKEREMVVYVGANDGMLHAFTSWVYDSSTSGYTRPAAAPADEHIGDELWAYIPQSLLPHLKWLPAADYTHVYYVDLKPKIFDAKILPDDTHYTDADTDDNWGTILLLGLNMGGKYIWAEGDFVDGSGETSSETRHFYPSYVCMDVTDPRNPRLLWERSYQDLEMTTSIPAVVKVKDKWFAVFGSGPSDYDGTSKKRGNVFVVDLKTGAPYRSGSNDWLFESAEPKAFMNSPVSFDKNLNYNVDAIYFGETYYISNAWKGRVYKVSIPWDWSDTSTYIDNPNHPTDPWTFSALFNAEGPITVPMSLSVDTFDNVWAYFGTGRYIGEDDKLNDDTQYLFGIKDPFFNSDYNSAPNDYYHNYNKTLTLDISNLFNSAPYIITTDGSVFNDGTGLSRITDWDTLLAAVRNTEDQGAHPDYFDGWYRTLTTLKERSVVKFSVLGGIVFAPTFIPDDDICGFGGESNLYGLYYETGTAYYKAVFLPEGTERVTIQGEEKEKVLDKMSLGVGKASALGIHVGQEEGALAFIQQGTGSIFNINVNPAFPIKSGLIHWYEK